MERVARIIIINCCCRDDLTAVDEYDYSSFYSSLLEEDMGNFDEDDYLERLNRLG